MSSMEKSLNKRSTLSRYRGMIISITVFILLILALLGLSFYASHRIARDTVTLNSAAQMRDLTQTMTRDLFNLKLSWGEDPNSPHIQATLKRLHNNHDLFGKNLIAFSQGGTIVDGSGQDVFINPVENKEDKDNLLATKQEWAVYGTMIKDYLDSALDVTVDSSKLDLAVDQAQSSSHSIYQNMEKLASNLQKEAAQNADLLKVVQLSGISFSILYFIIFIFYFMRKLRASDEEAENARRETTEIMATVKEGLFLLDSDLIIGGQYSQELENIIGQRDIGGKPLNDILECMVSKEDLDVTRGFVKQLFNNRVKANLISDLNPLNRIRVEVDDFSGFKAVRYLDFKFSRVYYGKAIERVLVSVTDITSAINLENRLAQEREQNDRQIEMLATILNTDGGLMESFVMTVRGCIERVNNTLRSPGKNTSELQAKVHAIYREIHSMKGEASALKLHGFVTIADSFEEKLKQLQNAPSISGNDFLPLTMMLDELVGVFNTIEKLSSRIGILGAGQSNKSTSDATLSTITATDNTAQAPRNVLQNYFVNFAKEMAIRNKKQVKLACHGMDNTLLDRNAAAVVKEIAIQLLRNAVCHGIELPAIRRDLGKNETGSIQLLLTQVDERSAQLVVEDNGSGIDFEKIRQKAVDKGLYSPEDAKQLDKKQLLNLIFTSGFSTMDGSSEDAGRGVGMDVVKDRIKGLGGNMKVASQAGKYTRFTVTIPLN